jgi:hypothetical protein
MISNEQHMREIAYYLLASEGNAKSCIPFQHN